MQLRHCQFVRLLQHTLIAIASLSLSLSNQHGQLLLVAKERLIFMREHANNAYGTMAYSLAHFLVHLPFLAFLAIIFSAYVQTPTKNAQHAQHAQHSCFACDSPRSAAALDTGS